MSKENAASLSVLGKGGFVFFGTTNFGLLDESVPALILSRFLGVLYYNAKKF